MRIQSDELYVSWRSGLLKRDRSFHPKNILRATWTEGSDTTVVHVLTSPDSNGESVYKQYQVGSGDGERECACPRLGGEPWPVGLHTRVPDGHETLGQRYLVPCTGTTQYQVGDRL